MQIGVSMLAYSAYAMRYFFNLFIWDILGHPDRPILLLSAAQHVQHGRTHARTPYTGVGRARVGPRSRTATAIPLGKRRK